MPRPSEDELIARYLAPLAGPAGLGLRDDAALIAPPPGHDLVVTKDMLVAGVHFFPDDPPDAIARKALRVNLSDLAAKGAEPIGILLGLGLPENWEEPWLAAFAAGLGEDCRTFGCPVLGGDTVAMPSSERAGPLTLSVTAFGAVPTGRMVPRTGTRAGDRLYVTGTIGDAALGLLVRWNRPEDRAWIAALAPPHREALLGRHLRPEPRLALRETLLANVRAAMDVSDGLAGDLAKMLALEGLGGRVDASRVPLSAACAAAVAREPHLLRFALTAGDDYEILCAVDPARANAFEAAASRAGIAVSALGEASRGAFTVVGSDGERMSSAQASFQHFT